jgi:DNA-binding CsgD family transcriptional regulator/PAS domain-containing protein
VDPAWIQLVEALYEVTDEPSRWVEWLTLLRDALAADSSALVFRFEPGSGHRGCVGTGLARGGATGAARAGTASDCGADPCLGALADDPRLLSRAIGLAPGDVLVLSEVLPETQFAASRFHRECLEPHGLYHVVCSTVDRSGDQVTSLSLMRGAGHPRFSAGELDRLRRLHPHLQRVVRLQEQLLAASHRSEVAEAALESVRCGAILLDLTGSVCGTNRRGAAMLERGEGVVRERGLLRAEEPSETAALRGLVCRATGCQAPRRGGVLALSRSGRAAPLFVSASPLDGHEASASWLGGPRALLLLSDPEDLPILSERLLGDLYALTPAEARVAARVARGERLDEIARALRVGRATVRTHLQQALAKTGTRRQVELARLLIAAPPGCVER